MKKCSTCKDEKDYGEFYRSRSSKDGYQTSCKDCQKRWSKARTARGETAKYSRTYYVKNREKEIRKVIDKRIQKKATLVAEAGGKCIRCNYKGTLRVFSFHHRNPDDKEFDISAKLSSYSIERLRREAAKCDLLCANCHMEVEEELFVARRVLDLDFPVISEVTGEHIA